MRPHALHEHNVLATAFDVGPYRGPVKVITLPARPGRVGSSPFAELESHLSPGAEGHGGWVLVHSLDHEGDGVQALPHGTPGPSLTLEDRTREDGPGSHGVGRVAEVGAHLAAPGGRARREPGGTRPAYSQQQQEQPHHILPVHPYSSGHTKHYRPSGVALAPVYTSMCIYVSGRGLYIYLGRWRWGRRQTTDDTDRAEHYSTELGTGGQTGLPVGAPRAAPPRPAPHHHPSLSPFSYVSMYVFVHI